MAPVYASLLRKGIVKKTIDDVPAHLQAEVIALLGLMVEDGTLSAERYEAIVGEPYEA